nr:reverse transcriptase domain-containing protein [Tanacetum cinerariifolium]
MLVPSPLVACQYLQHEHYALWEVIEFGDSYKAPLEETAKDKGLAGKVFASTKKKVRTVAITDEDMQKKKNDVKARTTLLLGLSDEHQLRFSKYDSVKVLWEVILKTFGRNEATKKTKKNQLKQQYGNFKAEGPKTLKQTFNRLQAIVIHLEFMDVPIEQANLNQKFLTSLAPEWHVTDVAAAMLSYDTVCAFIATQPNGSKIKYKDISQIDDDDIEEMDIKWNLALLSMRADRFWKKTGKKITIQGSDVADFDKSKVECFNCHKMGHFSRECISPRSQHRGKRESYKKDYKVEELAPKPMIAIDEEVPTIYALMVISSSSSDNEVYDDSFCSKSCRKNTKNLNTKISKLNEELSDCETGLFNYKRGLSIRVIERDIELKDNQIEYLRNELEEVKKEKESIDFKIEKFENASKDLDRLLESQKLDKDKKGVGFNEYCAVPPASAQVYSPLKKDLSWMGLPEFVDDIVTDYTRPTPSIDVSKSVSKKLEERWKRISPSLFEQGGSFGNVVSKPIVAKILSLNLDGFDHLWLYTHLVGITTRGSFDAAPDLISSSRLISNPSSNPTPSTNPNPKGRIRRRSKQRIEDFNLEELSPPIVMMADQHTMAQLHEAPTEGYEDGIVVPAITADNFEQHGLLTLVQNKQFFGHDKEDPHAHGAARIWLEKEPPRSIFTWDDLVSKFINQFFPPSKTTNLRNEITNFQQRFDESFSEAWDRFKDLLRACPHHGFPKLHQLDTFYNALNSKDQDSLNSTTGGKFLDKMPSECLAIIESKSKVCYSRNKPIVTKVSTNTSTSSISLDVAELKDMVKALLLNKKATNGNVYRDNIQEFVSQASAVNYNQGNTSYRPPMIFNQGPVYQPSVFQPSAYQAPSYQAPAPQTQGVSKEDFSAYVKANDAVVENKPEATKDTVNPTNNESTEDVQPQVVQSESLVLTSKNVTSPIFEPAISLVSASKSNPKTSIPYPSRRNDERNREKANNQIEKFYQIFKDMSFKISFADALILMPKFASTLKALIGNKEKLSEMARTPLNEHCSAILLKKLPEKLGDPGKFLIPCDFPRMAECLALEDLGASINLMPFSMWKRLSLPDLTPTCMTLELADHLISRPVGVAEDVYVKVGSFHFLADFIVVDFDADPRVPLILERSFLKTGRALIDVFEGELTLHVGKEAITFNLDQTSRYSANYSDMTAKRIDVIDMACEEYSQEVLGFSNTISSGNPTLFYDLIVSTTSPTLTPFGNSDFLLEEVDAFLAIEDDPTSPELYQPYLNPEGDILLLEVFLNDDTSLPPPNHRNYLPQVRKKLKICEAKSDKSSVDEPPEVELKDLPPHLEYAFLEGDDKLPVIIAKDLNVEEKTALITVLKSHKRAISWKLSDIKGIDPEFCTHKILMEEDFEPAFQHQRRVNPKIHDVIKQEEKTTFTCPYGTFAYRRMPFGLCNAPGTFQRCMMAIFHDMIEKTTEVFMDDFSVFGNSFQSCLSHLERMLKRCEDTNLCLNWEKSHFMVTEGIFLGHKISKQGIEVDKAKVDVITKLPHPTTIKGIRSFLGHASFYRRFIKDFSKIARPMTRLLEKDTSFIFSQECVEAFQTLKRKLTEAPILIALDWDIPFKLMCDASNFAIVAVLGQRQDKHFRPIHYASKTMTKAESNYTTTEKEMLAVVYAFEKFRSYLIMNKNIVYTDHSALKYLFAMKDSKARLLRWVLLL